MRTLHELKALGFDVRLENGRLRYAYTGSGAEPPAEVTGNLLADLSAHKDQAISYIQERAALRQIIKAIPNAIEGGITPKLCLERALYAISRLTGDAAYYTRSIQGVTHMLAPLYDLLEHDESPPVK